MAVQTTEEFKNGGATSYAITIEYLKASDIKVRIDGALQTYVASNPGSGQYTVSGTTVTLGATAASGTGNVHIYRETDVNTAAAVFQPGSSIRAADLNAIHDMARFASVEHRNQIINADIGTGAVTSDSILDGTIVNADVNANAAIAGTKINPHFGNQTISTTGTAVTGALGVVGDIDLTGNVDGRDVAADGTKLDTIETNAKDDQTAAEIKVLLQSDKITDAEIETGTLDNRYYTETELDGGQLDNRYYTESELDNGQLDNRYYTESELNNGQLDNRYYTETESDARYFNISNGETIKDGDTFPDNDTTIATTAAINDRIIDLVDDVGGFVPIANETSFPTSNPDVNNGAGTIVSVAAASTNLVPSGTTVTIANGRGSGLAVIITGVSATIPSGFGFLVETTTTAHTYTFHRLSPKATEVTAVAGKATEIGRLGTADAVADMAILGTADVVADLNTLGTADVVADMNMLATSDVVADMNMLAVSDVISDMNALATSDNITAMDTCSDNIASIISAASNISSAANFGDQYQVAANNPTTDGGGNALAAGDLYFNTSANELKIYTGSAWVAGVTQTGNFALTTGNTFSGDNAYNDGVKALFGTG